MNNVGDLWDTIKRPYLQIIDVGQQQEGKG